MENDQNTLSQDRESIGVEKSPLINIKNGLEKIKEAYDLWRNHGYSTIHAMERVQLSRYYYPNVVRFFEDFLCQEIGGELFPPPRVKQTIKPIEYYYDLTKSVYRSVSGLSEIQKDELGIIPTFALFSLMKNGFNGIDRKEYDTEKARRFDEFLKGDIVIKLYATQGMQQKFENLRWTIKDIHAGGIVIKSMNSNKEILVNASMIKRVSL